MRTLTHRAAKPSGVLLATLAAVAVGISTTRAADLGQSCCAELEERIAELDANTARKGNRKVKLTISGHMNQALLFWDDGASSDTYIVTNENKRTRFRFTGDAKITDGVKAGYRLEIGVRSANGRRVNQNDATAVDGGGLDLMHSWWWLESKALGKVSLGQTPMSAEGVTELTLANTVDIVKYSDVEDSGGGFFLRRDGVAGQPGLSSLQFFRLINNSGVQSGEGFRRNGVRYETPAIAGFVASTAFGADDYKDVGLRYTGEWSDVKVTAGIAYGESDEAGINGRTPGINCLVEGAAAGLAPDRAECRHLGGSIALYHTPTGLFGSFAGGRLIDDRIAVSNAFAGTNADDTSTFFAFQAGIEPKIFDVGRTTFFGEYSTHDGGANGRRTLAATDALNPHGVTSRIFATGLESIGGGIIQQFESAATSLYLIWRRYEPEVVALSGTAGAGVIGQVEPEPLDVVLAGALVKF